MADCVKLTYNGVTYELTYTRESVKQMEAAGFDFQDFVNGRRPATLNPLFFEGAFNARNRKMKRQLKTEIYEHLDNKSDLFVALAELYAATVETLVDTAAEADDGKKVTWTTE